MRRFEEQYRINEGDDVLNRENAIHQDVDLRLDAVELDAEAFRAGNRADIEAILKSLEQTFGTLAAEMRGLLDQTVGGLSADIVVETAARYFMTDARRSAILSDLRGGVAADGDTLAKLYARAQTINAAVVANTATLTAITNGADPTLDSFAEALTRFVIDEGQISGLMTMVGNRVRFDAIQALTAGQRKTGRSNLGVACGSGYLANAVTLAPGHIGFDFLVSSSAVVTLQDIANFADGDAMGFVGWDGSTAATIQVPAGSNTKIDLNGVQVSSFTLRPGQTARLSVWQGAWLVSAYAAPFGTTLGANEAQAFTDAQKRQLLANADIAIPHGQCRLNYVSATQIRLDPINGNKIFINGNYRTIPAAGVTFSNAGLSASTLYYIFSWMNGSALSLVQSTGAPVVDGLYGNKIAFDGNRNFVLVGMVYTDSNGQFRDDASFRGVASYYNKVARPILGNAGSGSTSSTSLVELNTNNRVIVAAFAGEVLDVDTGGSMYNSSANQGVGVAPGLDFAAIGPGNYYQDTTASMPGPAASRGSVTLTEGVHTVSVMGRAGGGTATVSAQLVGRIG